MIDRLISQSNKVDNCAVGQLPSQTIICQTSKINRSIEHKPNNDTRSEIRIESNKLQQHVAHRGCQRSSSGPSSWSARVLGVGDGPPTNFKNNQRWRLCKRYYDTRAKALEAFLYFMCPDPRDLAAGWLDPVEFSVRVSSGSNRAGGKFRGFGFASFVAAGKRPLPPDKRWRLIKGCLSPCTTSSWVKGKRLLPRATKQ